MIDNESSIHTLRVSGERLAKKCLRTGSSAFVTQEHLNDLPLLIHHTIQVEFVFAAKAEHFVLVPTGRGGQLRAKRLHPVEYRACGRVGDRQHHSPRVS